MKQPEPESRGTNEEFLSRWSRRKQQARTEAEIPEATRQLPAADPGAAPELPPIESLDKDSDYRGFFHPKVDESLRRAALKKLFSDPHFSIIDGLDIYLDDYSISDPLPAAMLGELKQAQKILGWAKERKEEEAARERAAAGLPAETPQALIADDGAVTVQPAESVSDHDAVAAEPESPDQGPQTA